MNSIESIIWEVQPFLDDIFFYITQDGIDVSRYELDHICYRVETQAEYEEMKNILDTVGVMLKWEHIVGGRPIASYKLAEPIRYWDRLISMIELPSPKQWSYYRKWWEHAEFVIDTSLEKFLSLHSHLEWSLWWYQKSINADISRKYSNGTSVKFHEQSLEYVIMELE